MSAERDLSGSDISAADLLYIEWARALGMDCEILPPNLEGQTEDEYVPSVRSQIDEWLDLEYESFVRTQWDKLVPKEGEAESVQGELVRSILRLEGEYWRNGMMNMGEGYYDSMVEYIKETLGTDESISLVARKVLLEDAAVVLSANYENIVRKSSIFEVTDIESAMFRIKMLIGFWCKTQPELIAR